MQIHLTNPLAPFQDSIITIGSFDGLHIGHKTIIEKLQEEAKIHEGETVIITFEPHPKTILQPNALVQNITTADEKVQLMQQLAIDHLVIYPFTKAFSNLTATEYVEDFIIKQFQPKVIVIGYDHHFGKDRTGNIKMLESYAAKGHFKLIEIPEQTINEASISSTKIRNALLYGEIENANKLLGYAYFFSGTIVQGKQLGRTIGFKTANLQVQNSLKLIPGNGVYVVSVQWKNRTMQGMMNIGTRPTVDGMNRVIEVHILNFDEEIYGEELTITILSRLRNEQKFNGLDALKEQLEKDRQATATYFQV
jgi:riboflavin kinase / FMN adenylyltransferase